MQAAIVAVAVQLKGRLLTVYTPVLTPVSSSKLAYSSAEYLPSLVSGVELCNRPTRAAACQVVPHPTLGKANISAQ